MWSTVFCKNKKKKNRLKLYFPCGLNWDLSNRSERNIKLSKRRSSSVKVSAVGHIHDRASLIHERSTVRLLGACNISFHRPGSGIVRL